MMKAVSFGQKQAIGRFFFLLPCQFPSNQIMSTSANTITPPIELEEVSGLDDGQYLAVDGSPDEPNSGGGGDMSPKKKTKRRKKSRSRDSSRKGGSAERKVKQKITFFFAMCCVSSMVMNLYTKKVLNVFPFPWLMSTLSLATGSILMLVSWTVGIADPPETDFEFWKALFPVAAAHTIGHVAATVSVSKVAVSFTQIIRSGEPAISVTMSRLLLGESYTLPVYLSLVPIIGGCALSALTELDFNMTGFMGAMIANIAFVFRNIFSKRGMKGKSVNGMNYYACLSTLSLLLLAPFTVAVEGPKMWAAGFHVAFPKIGTHLFWWMLAQCVFYHLTNQVSYMSLEEITPLTFSIGNTMKRITVIVSSIIIFRNKILPINAVGAAITILGTFFYSQARS